MKVDFNKELRKKLKELQALKSRRGRKIKGFSEYRAHLEKQVKLLERITKGDV